ALIGAGRPALQSAADGLTAIALLARLTCLRPVDSLMFERYRRLVLHPAMVLHHAVVHPLHHGAAFLAHHLAATLLHLTSTIGNRLVRTQAGGHLLVQGGHLLAHFLAGGGVIRWRDVGSKGRATSQHHH